MGNPYSLLKLQRVQHDNAALSGEPLPKRFSREGWGPSSNTPSTLVGKNETQQ